VLKIHQVNEYMNQLIKSEMMFFYNLPINNIFTVYLKDLDKLKETNFTTECHTFYYYR
jgi:hypothetical protein